MQNKVVITCDSTCDLTPDIMEKYGIHILPLVIVMGENEYRDAVDIVPADIFAYFEKNKQLAKTTAVNVAEYYGYFKKFTDQGLAVIHINISAEMSVCHHNACKAAAELPNAYAVDSRNLSTGSGLLVIRAAELAKEGMKAPEIVKELNEMALRVDASFIIDTLEYLHKGGRCSSVAALGANLLRLKPCIEVVNGKMGVGKKYRGKIDEVLPKYTADRLLGADDIDKKRIFITYADIVPETVKKVLEIVRATGDFGEIIECTVGSTVAVHCGPGTLGVLFERKTKNARGANK
ncbi:MAG TPA: DegV family protein [Ruminococcaceae bacterium]|nr:DegV family protein [Oscillospiraceae bacterium]